MIIDNTDRTQKEWRQTLTSSAAKIFDLEKAISAAVYASVKGPGWRSVQIIEEIDDLRDKRDDAVCERYQILKHRLYGFKEMED